MNVAENLDRILESIKNYHPRIIAVTKYYDIDKMIEAYNAGVRDFAESRALEATQKINKIDDTIKSQSVYHFIGHLQTNKVKYVVSNFEYIHSVDSLRVAQCIDSAASKCGIKQKILLQVNNAREAQKFGIDTAQIENLINEISLLKSVELKGFMNIAPLDADIEELKRLFSQMQKLKEIYNMEELSMGMSRDYKVAVEYGATMIRLGRILFE